MAVGSAWHARGVLLHVERLSPDSVTPEKLVAALTGRGGVQADTEEELPEHLLGTVRLSRLEVGKAVAPVPAVP